MLRPVSVWIVAKRLDKVEVSEGGLYLPAVAQEHKHAATVVAVGPDVKIQVKPGDKVVFGRYAGDEFEGEMLIKEDEVMAVWE